MWRRKADDWCTSRVSGRSILLAVNCGPVELPSRSAVARSTLFMEVLLCVKLELATGSISVCEIRLQSSKESAQ